MKNMLYNINNMRYNKHKNIRPQIQMADHNKILEILQRDKTADELKN